jgi:hypothetical protein
MFRIKSRLVIVCATQYPPSPRAVCLIRCLTNLVTRNNLSIIVSQRNFIPDDLQHLVSQKSLRGTLFDFSRYSDALNCIDSGSIVLMFNDTLGYGRKLRFPLMLFIAIAILLIELNTCAIACPIDRDEYSTWICPYFVVGRCIKLRMLNWIDYEKAIADTSEEIQRKCSDWILEGWRHSKVSSQAQKAIKYKTLILERGLINQAYPIKILGFDKLNLLRMLNSIFPF